MEWQKRREQWLVEQLAAAWNWTEKEVLAALDKDAPTPKPPVV